MCQYWGSMKPVSLYRLRTWAVEDDNKNRENQMWGKNTIFPPLKEEQHKVIESMSSSFSHPCFHENKRRSHVWGRRIWGIYKDLNTRTDGNKVSDQNYLLKKLTKTSHPHWKTWIGYNWWKDLLRQIIISNHSMKNHFPSLLPSLFFLFEFKPLKVYYVKQILYKTPFTTCFMHRLNALWGVLSS